MNALPANFNITMGGLSYSEDLSNTRKMETQRRHAREKVDRLSIEISIMEAKLGITGATWDSTTPEYIETLAYMAKQLYHKTLDKLEKLVIQRLFELQRLHLSGIGEYFSQPDH